MQISTISLCFCLFLPIWALDTSDFGYINTYVNISGDVMIGGLYEAHEYAKDYYIRCGRLSPQYALLSEAHVFSTKYINEHLLKDKNFTLGALLLDTCYSDAIGIQNAMNFIRDDSHGFCFEAKEWFKENGSIQHTVYSVTGAFSSGIAKYVNYLLSAYCMPLLGATATDSEFDDREHYSNFLRTTTSDRYQTQALFEILQELNWTRINVIFEGHTYGAEFKEVFKKIVVNKTIDERSICVQNYIKYSGESMEDFEGELRPLFAPESPRVLLLFMNYIMANKFLALLKGFNATHRFQIVGTDGWGGLELSPNISDVVQGAIGLEPWSPPLKEFEDYLLKNITISSVKSYNPWLVELMEKHHNCTTNIAMPGVCFAESEVYINCTAVKTCQGNETLPPIPGGALRRARNVFQSLYVIAEGLIRLQEESCPKPFHREWCRNLTRTITGLKLCSKMQQCSFNLTPQTDGINASFHFYQPTGGEVANGAPPKFYVLKAKTVGSMPEWDVVGEKELDESINWFVDDVLEPDLEQIVHEDMYQWIPTCAGRTFIHQQMDQKCRYVCKNCSETKDSLLAIVNLSDPTNCSVCSDGYVPDATFTKCVKEHVDFRIKTSEGMAVILGVCIMSSALMAISGCILYVQKDTPMAKGAAVDLLLYLMVSEILLFATPSLLLPSNSALFCGCGWVVLSVALTLNHVLLLIKSVRLARPAFYIKWLDQLRKFERYAKLSDTEANKKLSLFLMVILLLLQCVLVFFWIVFQPPELKYEAKGAGYIHYCSSNDHWQTLVVLTIIPMIYLILTVFFLKIASRNPFMYTVHQVRFMLGGWFCLEVQYTILFVVFIVTKAVDVEDKAIVFMCIPMVTGIVFWLSLIFPVTYALVFKRKRNTIECVVRKRAQLFVEGNQISIVTPVTYPKKQTSRSIFHVPSDTNVA